jgi:hypothetical protein
MDALAKPNFEGLDQLLDHQPASAKAWTFVRGQALVIAETGNLLMLRPPRTEGRDVWLERAADLRAAATRLARAAGQEQYDNSRVALQSLGAACNRCHQSFRVSVRVGRPAPQPGRDSSEPVP